MNTRYYRRVECVEYYLKNKKPLRTTAKKLGISWITLWRWVRWYKKGGTKNLNREEKFKPWNKLDSEIEKKVAILKENNPSLTISTAQKILLRTKINISSKGIWSIWKRYGLTSSYSKQNDEGLSQIIPRPESILSPEIEKVCELSKTFGKIPFPEYYKKAKALSKDWSYDPSTVRLYLE